MEPGDKCICSIDELYNAFGDKQTCLVKGQRLVVRESRRIAGSRFYSFNGIPPDHWFIYEGFTPLRNLN